MSVIFEIKPDLSNLIDFLDRYDMAIKDLEEELKLKGKQLAAANSENPSMLAYYDERKTELKSLVQFMEMRVDKIRGELWRKYTESHSRDLGPKDKEMYIKSEPEYLKSYQLLICVQEMYSRYNVAVDAFIARGFSLRNITNARVAQVDSGLI